MSLKQAYKDYLTVIAIFGLIIVLVGTLYQYIQTNDVKMLYIGLGMILFIVLGTIARYRYVVDYIWTLLKSWR